MNLVSENYNMPSLLTRFYLSLLTLVLTTTLLVAQPPKKRTTEEEEDTTPPAKKTTPQEKAAPPTTIVPQKEPPKLQSITWGPFNLAEEAKLATHPEAKKYLQDLSLTAEQVTSTSGKVYRTAPIAKKYDPKLGKSLDFTPLDGAKMVLNADQIREVKHYEQRVDEKTRAFLDRRFDAPGTQPALSRFLQLRAAEMALTEALRYHQTLLAQGNRDARTWAGTEADLKSALANTRIDELRALAAERDYATGEALAQKMFLTTPGDRAMLDVIEQLYVKQCEELFAENRFLEARLMLESLQAKYRNTLTSMPTRRVIERLEEQARKNFEIAKKATDEKNRSAALSALEIAEQAWPTLPGLREFRVKTLGEYSVLRIGVRQLPTVFSPLTAMTDADKMACRLIYEPLVEARSAPSTTQGYTPVVTDTPRRIPRGYEFVLPSYLKWSDGSPVKSDDVLRSFEFVSKPGTPRYDPSVENDGLFLVNQIDETRFTITFKTPVIDELSHLNFPLLPASRLPRDQSSTAAASAFAKNPLGTGPYMFSSVEGDEVVFKVNPHYNRPHLPHGPAIKEIRFIRYSDWSVARQALLDGRWHMLLDGTSKEMDEVTGNPQVILTTPTESKPVVGSTIPQLTNPRIYFLGFNYRKPVFQKKEAREAVSMAINRENIIETIYRGKTKTHHAVLNGPFPLNSWAYDTGSFNQSPYASVQAAAKVRSAGGMPAIRLAVLAEDLHAVEACNLIKLDLEKVGIKCTVAPMPANSLFVEMHKPSPDFDLLYASWDFPNENFNLRPLLDPSAASGQGANFMGFQLPPMQQDTTLNRYMSNAMNNRDLENARRQMYSIHKHMNDNAIIAPLYQLDKHVAVHRSLDQHQRFHPVHVFDGVERWVLKTSGQ